jgi:hypothetical protein
MLPGILNAAVVLPALDIQDMDVDTGASLTTTSFYIDATVFTIVTDGDPVDIADEVFTLTSTSGSYDPNADEGYGYGAFAGTFTVGGGLLSGSFSNLEVFGYGNDTTFDFEGDLVFDSGSLMGGFDSGRIEGTINGNAVIAKLGAVTVVPVPAAVWLFGSGLIGLVGVARRKA